MFSAREPSTEFRQGEAVPPWMCEDQRGGKASRLRSANGMSKPLSRRNGWGEGGGSGSGSSGKDITSWLGFLVAHTTPGTGRRPVLGIGCKSRRMSEGAAVGVSRPGQATERTIPVTGQDNGDALSENRLPGCRGYLQRVRVASWAVRNYRIARHGC